MASVLIANGLVDVFLKLSLVFELLTIEFFVRKNLVLLLEPSLAAVLDIHHQEANTSHRMSLLELDAVLHVPLKGIGLGSREDGSSAHQRRGDGFSDVVFLGVGVREARQNAIHDAVGDEAPSVQLADELDVAAESLLQAAMLGIDLLVI